MITTTLTGLRRKIAWLLHWGCVEIRALAFLGGQDETIADLADALENLPRYLNDAPTDEDWEVICSVIEGYAARNPSAESRLASCSHKIHRSGFRFCSRPI